MERMALFVLAWLGQLSLIGQITNGSFENAAPFNVIDWNLPCACAPYQFSSDVPVGGGSWSLGVGIMDVDNCLCTVTDAIHQPTTWLYPGQWVLSGWIKNADPGNIPGAAIRISQGPAFSSTILADAWSFTGIWTAVNDTFLVTSSTNISALQVSLIPDDGNQIQPGLFAYFDQIMIEPILGTGIESRYPSDRLVYPNPSETNISIVLPGQVIEIILVDALGRQTFVRDHIRREATYTINVRDLSSGPWVIKAITTQGVTSASFIRSY